MLKPFTERNILIFNDQQDEGAEILKWIAEAERNLDTQARMLDEKNSEQFRKFVSAGRGIDAVVFLDKINMVRRAVPRVESHRLVISNDKDKEIIRPEAVFKMPTTEAERTELFKETSHHLEMMGHCEIVSDAEFMSYFPTAYPVKPNYQVVFLCIEEVNSFIKFLETTYDIETIERRVEGYFFAKPDTKRFSMISRGRLNFLTKLVFLHELGHALCNHNAKTDVPWAQMEAEANYFASLLLFNTVDSLFLLFLVSLYAEAYDRVILARLGYLTKDGTFSCANHPDELWDALVHKKYLE